MSDVPSAGCVVSLEAKFPYQTSRVNNMSSFRSSYAEGHVRHWECYVHLHSFSTPHPHSMVTAFSSRGKHSKDLWRFPSLMVTYLTSQFSSYAVSFAVMLWKLALATMSTLSKAFCPTLRATGVLCMLLGPLICIPKKLTLFFHHLSPFKSLLIFNCAKIICGDALCYQETANVMPLANTHLEMLVWWQYWHTPFFLMEFPALCRYVGILV